MYIRDCDIIIITFDLTNKDTFNNINKWYDLIKTYYVTPEIIIVANKVDLDIYRVVSKEEIEDFILKTFIKNQ